MTTEERIGRFEILGTLGRGGMGRVLKARDPKSGQTVAIKVLPSSIAGSTAMLARFEREGDILARLSHPHIVAGLEPPRKDGETAYFVMEYVEGEPLSNRLRQGPLPLAQGIAVVRQVLQALEAAHQEGVIHRDVKPSNVLLDRAGSAKVSDFGLGRGHDSESLTVSGEVMGTPDYMSPEQAAGERTDHRTDLYSAGILLYEVLCGRPPFQADKPLAVLRKHLEEEPIAPSMVRPGLPPSLDGVVLTALAKKPEQRFQSAADFEQALTRAAKSLPKKDPPLAVPTEETVTLQAITTTRTRRRSRLVVAVGAIFISVLVGGAILTLTRVVSPKSRGGEINLARIFDRNPPAAASAEKADVSARKAPGAPVTGVPTAEWETRGDSAREQLKSDVVEKGLADADESDKTIALGTSTTAAKTDADAGRGGSEGRVRAQTRAARETQSTQSADAALDEADLLGHAGPTAPGTPPAAPPPAGNALAGEAAAPASAEPLEAADADQQAVDAYAISQSQLPPDLNASFFRVSSDLEGVRTSLVSFIFAKQVGHKLFAGEVKETVNIAPDSSENQPSQDCSWTWGEGDLVLGHPRGDWTMLPVHPTEGATWTTAIPDLMTGDLRQEPHRQVQCTISGRRDQTTIAGTYLGCWVVSYQPTQPDADDQRLSVLGKGPVRGEWLVSDDAGTVLWIEWAGERVVLKAELSRRIKPQQPQAQPPAAK